VLALFCLNGLFGWLMVSTGLKDQPRVSHYMLALHLVTALIVLGCCLWQFLRHWQPHHPEWPDRRGRTQIRPWAIWFCVAVLLQMGVGGLMAGLDAGHVSYTFPKMNGYWLLPGLLSGQGILADMGSHLPLVHFEHRVLGMLVGVFAVFLYLSWAYRVNCDRTRWAVNLVGVICAVQVALGISVLFTHMDIRMALAHQMNGSLLWLAALYLLYCTCSEPTAEGGSTRVS
jgi:cytochrome c oxidase assembly protein subunit 15